METDIKITKQHFLYYIFLKSWSKYHQKVLECTEFSTEIEISHLLDKAASYKCVEYCKVCRLKEKQLEKSKS